MKRTITHQNETLEYTLKQKNVKNVNLRITPDGAIQITVPYDVSSSSVEDFIVSKWQWIRDSRQKVIKRNRLHKWDGQLSVFGDSCRLQIKKGAKRIVPGSEFIVYYPDETDGKSIRVYLEKYLKGLLEEEIKVAREHYDQIIMDYHQPLPEIRLRKMNSRWGSCLVKKRSININTALIHYPKECLNYVLLHEYLHLIVPNHSKRFYDLLDYHMPDHKRIKNLLNNYR